MELVHGLDIMYGTYSMLTMELIHAHLEMYGT